MIRCEITDDGDHEMCDIVVSGTGTIIQRELEHILHTSDKDDKLMFIFMEVYYKWLNDIKNDLEDKIFKENK